MALAGRRLRRTDGTDAGVAARRSRIVTPEARDCLAEAGEDLADARKILEIGLNKAAARSGYHAAFHAA